MGSLRWTIAFFFLVCGLGAQAQLDSLYQVFQHQSLSTAHIDSANFWLWQYTHSNPELARKMARENLHRAQEEGYEFGEVEAQARMGLALDYLSELDSACNLYLVAAKRHAQLGNHTEAFSNYHNAGLARFRSDRYEEALALYRIAEQFSDSTGVPRHRAIVLSNLGKVYRKMEMFAAAEDAFFKSLEVREASGDTYGMTVVLEALVNLYTQQDRFAEAAPLVEKGMAYAEQIGDTLFLVSFLTKQGRLRVDEGNYSGAIEAFEKALQVGKNRHAQDAQPEVSHYWIGFSLFQMERHREAIRSGEKALEYALAIHNKLSEVKIRTQLAEWNSAAGRHPAAYQQMKLAYELEQEIRGEQVADLVAEETVRFRLDSIRNVTLLETEKRRNQEQLAAERLEKVEAVQQNNRYLLVLLALVAAFLALLSYFLWKNQKDRRQIEAQKKLLEASLEEKEVLMREIHHRVKNNLQSIASMLQIQRRRSNNEVVKETLGNSLVRISTLSRVHAILYQQQDLSDMDGEAILREVVDKVLAGFNTEAEVELQIQSLHLNQDQLLYLGFIVNEWLTNAIKYGGQGANTRLRIVSEIREGIPCIVLWENGPGFVPAQVQRGFGLNMMESIAGRMGGRLVYDSSSNQTVIFLEK